MKLILYKVILFIILLASINSAWAMSGENTYIFAAAACPPWKTKELGKHAKNIAFACGNNVHLITSTFKEALNIPSDNIMTILDEEATYEGLKTGLENFADIAPKNSRAVLYFNLHGIFSRLEVQNIPEKEEVFVLWTEKKPFTILSALATQKWIDAVELRKMIDSINAQEIILIIDSCHAGGAVHDILKKHGRKNSWKGLEAVIMSSDSDQYSYLDADGSYGLFTYYFSKAIAKGSPNIQSAFIKASQETIRYFENASNQKKCTNMLKENLNRDIRCIQTPLEYDPSGLLKKMKFIRP